MDPEVNSPPVVSRRPLVITALVLVLLILLSALFFYFRAHKQAGFVSGFVTDPESNLAATSGRTNLVFLGYGGEGHQAGDLTDSILFISLSHHTHSITLLSIPRDIWVTTMAAKINTAYHYGQQRREGGGLDLAKSAVAEITGEPVHYALALDFEGFVKGIDAVGGVEVEVKRAFDDYQYPVPGKEDVEPESERYEHLHFDQGLTHMDGATALKFARSRNSQGEEGTDFARSSRQQQIIIAFKDKLLNTETLLDFNRLQDIIGGFRKHIDTDIKDGEFGSFFRFFLAYQNQQAPLTTLSLDDLLQTPSARAPYQGQWVLVPKDDWSTVHAYVQENLAK